MDQMIVEIKQRFWLTWLPDMCSCIWLMGDEIIFSFTFNTSRINSIVQMNFHKLSVSSKIDQSIRFWVFFFFSYQAVFQYKTKQVDPIRTLTSTQRHTHVFHKESQVKKKQYFFSLRSREKCSRFLIILNELNRRKPEDFWLNSNGRNWIDSNLDRWLKIWNKTIEPFCCWSCFRSYCRWKLRTD